MQSCDSFGGSPVKYDGRIIHYHVADDDGNVNDEIEGHSFNFKGQTVEELTQKLEEETELKEITVCSKNKINGKLYPLRLCLPPNNATMRVVVVPSTSRGLSLFHSLLLVLCQCLILLAVLQMLNIYQTCIVIVLVLKVEDS